MIASILGPALLLLASAVAAQDTPSVATFISISPVPTTEEVFTIQTSVPSTSTTPCYEVCVQEPCTACSPLPTSDELMSIPPGETPEPSAVISVITDPLLSSVSGNLSIPTGETPISTGSLDTPVASSLSLSPSLTSSAPPEQTTNAAPLAMNGGGTPVVLALAGAAFALL